MESKSSLEEHLGLGLNYRRGGGAQSIEQGVGSGRGMGAGRGLDLQGLKDPSEPCGSESGTHVIGRPPGLKLQVPLQQRRLQPQEFLRKDGRPVEVLVGEDGPDRFQVLSGKKRVGHAPCPPPARPRPSQPIPGGGPPGRPTLRTVSCTEGTGWRGRERW